MIISKKTQTYVYIHKNKQKGNILTCESHFPELLFVPRLIYILFWNEIKSITSFSILI